MMDEVLVIVVLEQKRKVPALAEASASNVDLTSVSSCHLYQKALIVASESPLSSSPRTWNVSLTQYGLSKLRDCAGRSSSKRRGQHFADQQRWYCCYQLSFTTARRCCIRSTTTPPTDLKRSASWASGRFASKIWSETARTST